MAQNSACSSALGMWPSAVNQAVGPSWNPGPGMGRARTSSTRARAAFSISSTEGIPRSSMALRSISRICSAV